DKKSEAFYSINDCVLTDSLLSNFRSECKVNLAFLRPAAPAATTSDGSAETAMSKANSRHSESSRTIDCGRRLFLEKVAMAGATAAILWPGSAKAVMELWEEGDPLCGVHYDALPKPDGYELDIPYLESFLGVSKSLTGLTEFDRHIANQYMERFATHPQ